MLVYYCSTHSRIRADSSYHLPYFWEGEEQFTQNQQLFEEAMQQTVVPYSVGKIAMIIDGDADWSNT